VNGCPGRKPAQEVEDNKRQYNAHILVVRLGYPEHIKKCKLAINNYWTCFPSYYIRAFTNTKQDPTLQQSVKTVHVFARSKIPWQISEQCLIIFSHIGSQQQYNVRQETVNTTVPSLHWVLQYISGHLKLE